MNINITEYEPLRGETLWAKPCKDGFTFKVLFNGEWKPIRIEEVEKKEEHPVEPVKKEEKIVDSLLRYKGVVNASKELPVNLTANDTGDTYIVGTKATYFGKKLVVGDYIIWNGSSWDILKAGNRA